MVHAGCDATAGENVGPVGNRPYTAIFRTDPHAGGGATADENFTPHVILRGYRRRRAAIFRAVLHAGRDATTDEAVEYYWPFGVHAMEAVE